jgi:tRNA dimethylallyltransferase
MSEIKNEWETAAPDFTGILITRDRADLYQRINQRTTQMWQEGILEEVRQATQLSTTAIKAIGIQEIQAHLAGEIPLDDCLDLIRQATRRYAKRQLSWFRREKGFQSVCLAPDDSPDSALKQIRQRFPALFSK